MIIYFADRYLNILGQASTHLPEGARITDDLKTEDVETGVAIFECDVHFDRRTRKKIEEWADVGNFILRSSDDNNECYQIIDATIDTKKKKVTVYAEDNGLDLLNEIAGPFEATEFHPISYYINKYASGSGWEIGINEVEGLTRQLKWDSEQTASARLLSIAEAFNNCELSFGFEIDGLQITKKYIHIYEKRGQDTGVQLRLNKEIDSIIIEKSISNIATALKATGGTPDNSDEPVTLLGYEYDDGDFYVDGSVLKSRTALTKWNRFLWKKGNSEQEGGHIVKQFSFDTTSQQVLCEKTIEHLKQICDAEINYDVDISDLPENIRIGDRVNVIDDEGELYLSSRVLILETCGVDNTRRAILGEHLIQKSGISTKVEKLAAEFAQSAVSVSKAYEAAKVAKDTAQQAQEQAVVADEKATELKKTVVEVQGEVVETKGMAEDASKTATDAAKTATDYLEYTEFEEDHEVQVGNKTSGSWAGFRAQITSKAFNILNDVGDICASYGAKLIELGKNATDAVIKLCGGKGKIEFGAINKYTGEITPDDENGYLKISADKVEVAGDAVSLKSRHYTLHGEYGEAGSFITGGDSGVSVDESHVSMWISQRAPGEWDEDAGDYVGPGNAAETSSISMSTSYTGFTSPEINIRSVNDINLGTTYGTVRINDMEYAVNKVLWYGAKQMITDETITLGEAVSAQPHGIVLIFSRYNVSTSTPENYHFNTEFIPKEFVAKSGGGGHSSLIVSDASFGLFAAKYLYIHDAEIVGGGNDVNTAIGTGACGIKYTNNAYVLRYVIGV